ncbi:unnamed protein product, partial [Brugia pahangi]
MFLLLENIKDVIKNTYWSTKPLPFLFFQIQQLQCLNSGCDSYATQTQIRQVLTDKEFEIYEQRLLEVALDLMSDVVICPRISCQAPVIVDDGENSRYTIAYEFSIMLDLSREFSIMLDFLLVLTEVEVETLTKLSKLLTMSLFFLYIVQEIIPCQVAVATPAQLEEIYKRFGGKKQVEQLLQVLKNEEWIKCNSKACPSCHAKIEKNSGCNKMTCIKCGRSFCWLCGTVLDK